MKSEGEGWDGREERGWEDERGWKIGEERKEREGKERRERQREREREWKIKFKCLWERDEENVILILFLICREIV